MTSALFLLLSSRTATVGLSRQSVWSPAPAFLPPVPRPGLAGHHCVPDREPGDPVVTLPPADAVSDESVSNGSFLESAALWGVGFLLTFEGFPLCPHYLLVMYPLPWIWVARLGTATGRKGRTGLAVIWCSQLLVSALFLYYIHAHHGALFGDFGVSYGYQRH